MDKVEAEDIDEIFPKLEIRGAPCLSSEDIEEALNINKHMRKVTRDANMRFVLSQKLSRGLILRQPKNSSFALRCRNRQRNE